MDSSAASSNRQATTTDAKIVVPNPKVCSNAQIGSSFASFEGVGLITSEIKQDSPPSSPASKEVKMINFTSKEYKPLRFSETTSASEKSDKPAETQKKPTISNSLKRYVEWPLSTEPNCPMKKKCFRCFYGFRHEEPDRI